MSAQRAGDGRSAARAGCRLAAASVYRVVDELCELALLHRLDGRDGIARFEIADPERHHHHFVDERTGAVEAFADEGLERAIDAVGERLGVELEWSRRGAARHASALIRGLRGGPAWLQPDRRIPLYVTTRYSCPESVAACTEPIPVQ